MKCLYCGGTGRVKDGSPCTHCQASRKSYIFGDSQVEFINKQYLNTNFIKEFNQQLYTIIQTYSEDTNYIITYSKHESEETALIFLAQLQKRLLEQKKSILPLFLNLQLNQLTKCLYYQKPILYRNKEITPEVLQRSSILPLALTTKASNFELDDLQKIIDLRYNNSSNILVVTTDANFIPVKKYQRTEYVKL